MTQVVDVVSREYSLDVSILHLLCYACSNKPRISNPGTMKLFISYRRKSWPFSQRLVDELQKRIDAEIFIDYTSIDETDFEVSILRHLRESDAVLLIVSEYTFAQDRIHRDDDWVRREIREALKLHKPIVVALVDGQTIPDIPVDIQDIKRMQRINFYQEYFDPAVTRLVEFIVKATPLELVDTIAKPAAMEVSQLTEVTLGNLIELVETEDYDRAVFLIEELKKIGYQSPVISLDDLLHDTEKHRLAALRRREAVKAYNDIAALARSKIMLVRAQQAWKIFRQEFPEFDDDPEDLSKKLRVDSEISSRDAQSVSSASMENTPNVDVPDFDNISPDEIMDWMESLAKRQGASEFFTPRSEMLGVSDVSSEDEELYKQAVEMVRRLNKASISLLQRRFRIGYARAARLIDLMEKRGIIGPATGNSEPRKVLPIRKSR